ncbi:hypothetical protein L3X38_032491 [Prunus dulcis]|uniref:Uncharacterized protein n=1 Tax=Prunus dulcis TaxID=3755 RepID=A0AAD4VFK0_PRUDU|nr:hypothetical protein L3X38_032491 [Prunus dulcis]
MYVWCDLGGRRLVCERERVMTAKDECSARPLSKRKADVKSSRNEAATSRAKDLSSLTKKPRIPSAKKTQVGAIPPSSARVKQLDGAGKKIGSMRNIWDVPLKPPVDKLGDRDMLRELGVDSALLTSLKVRMAADKKTKELFAKAEGSSTTLMADLQVDKSSLARDAGMSERVVVAAETIRNSSAIAPTSAADLFEAITDAYKLGYLDCTNGSAPFYAIGDKDIEMHCPNLPPVQREQVNTVDMKKAEEQEAQEAGGAAKSMANHVDAEKAADQGSPASILE